MLELGQEQGKWGARPAAEACTRRGAARPGGGGGGGPATRGCAQAVAAGRAGCSSAGAAGSGGAGLRGARRVNFCGLGRGGGVCVCTCVRRPAARASAARTSSPPLRVPRQPAVFVQLRSSRAAPAHPGAAPAGKPFRAAWPAGAAAATTTGESGCCSPGEKRGVRGDRLAGPSPGPGGVGRGSRELRELGAGAPDPGSASVHGKVDMETVPAPGVWGDRRAGAAGSWDKSGRGRRGSASGGSAGLTPRTPALLAHLRPVILLGRPRTPAPLRPA